MRVALGLILLTGMAAAAADNAPIEEPLPRYGVNVKLSAYPQTTARRTLESALDAIEKGDFTYLVAHLLDPAFVNQRVAERSKQFEAAAEAELIRLRDFQYANPDRFDPADRLPKDKVQFQALVLDKSREQAFKQLGRDVEAKLRDDPQTIKDLRKILNDGAFTEEAGGAKAVHPAVKERTLYFKKIDNRWFLENRQTEEPRKEP